MTSLGHLDVSGTAITNDGLRFLEPLTHLRHLLLNETDISDDGLRYLEPLKSLDTLSLKGTSISDDGLSFLATYHNLYKHLVLSNTKVTATGVAALQKALPDCKIDFGSLATDDPDREVAEWVLDIGGRVEVAVTDNKPLWIGDLEKLPLTSFRVSGVDLNSNNRLTDDDLRKLSGLSALRTLFIDRTAVTSAGLSHLAELQTLEHVTVRGMNVHDGFGYFSKSSLKMFAGKVGDWGAGLAELGVHDDLKELDIENLNITEGDLKPISRFHRLPKLWISGSFSDPCVVTEDGMRLLAGLSELEFLCLRICNLDGTGFEFLRESNVPLKSVMLEYCPITDDGLAEIVSFSHIQDLELKFTNVTAHGLGQVKSLPEIRTLRISGPIINDESIRSLEGMTVYQLMVSQTAISDAGMGAFKKLGGCTILSISENSQTTNDGIMQLGAIPGLKIISIKKSDLITTDGIQAFHKAFPDVLIR